MDEIFKNKKVDSKKLLDFGFKKTGSGYLYSTTILNGQFSLEITITKAGKISTKTIDTATLEPYTLHLSDSACGKYIGEVREEYENVLKEISSKCFYREVFKNKQSKNFIAYAKEKYGDELEFLWEKHPECAILRRKDTEKWYAVIMLLHENKLRPGKGGNVEIIDLRGEPDWVVKNVDDKLFYPGYHMNKKHWYTIILDNTIEDNEVFRLTDLSYNLAKK